MSRIVVFHGYYGCDTGCCGHVIEMDGVEEFKFEHPWIDGLQGVEREQAARQFIIDLVNKECGPGHADDIDFSACLLSDD
jgi:hypothetical protein